MVSFRVFHIFIYFHLLLFAVFGLQLLCRYEWLHSCPLRRLEKAAAKTKLAKLGTATARFRRLGSQAPMDTLRNFFLHTAENGPFKVIQRLLIPQLMLKQTQQELRLFYINFLGTRVFFILSFSQGSKNDIFFRFFSIIFAL